MIAQRWMIELVCIIALIGALIGWWHEHNKHEQVLGQEQCLKQVTVTMDQGVDATDAINAEHARILSTVVDTYDAKIKALNAGNADLAQRLHDRAAAEDGARAVSRVGAPAGFVCSPANHTAPTKRDREEAATLEACAANTIELEALRQAWTEQAAKQAPH